MIGISNDKLPKFFIEKQFGKLGENGKFIECELIELLSTYLVQNVWFEVQ
jgi:hypothetical protein